MKYFNKLVGDNIYLSPRSVEDAEKFTEWLNDFETTDYIGRSGAIVTVESEKEYLEEHIRDEANFVIVNLSNEEIIGTIGLLNINHLQRTAVLGIFIGDKTSRNKGYGTESIKLLLDYGFNYLNLKTISF